VPSDAPGSTALVVLTAEARPVIGEIYRAHANAGRDGMTPHVTLIVPFVGADRIDDAVEPRLGWLFGRFEAFDYHLRRFEQFESGVLYLAPEPPHPFVDLTLALADEFPEYPPYEGIHDDVIPHVTVAGDADAELLARIRAEIEPQLPIECRAEQATLVQRGSDLRWRPRASYSLGSRE
jgi:2'-5' RNA ligase